MWLRGAVLLVAGVCCTLAEPAYADDARAGPEARPKKTETRVVLDTLPPAAVADVVQATAVLRARYALSIPDESILADPDTALRLSFAYAALSKTAELHIHQMRGATKNRVYLSPDGHSEAVVDEKGKLVTDCANMHSYNFFPAAREPLGHFLYDMVPWMELGNCRNDPTSRNERMTAYLQDFRNGAIQAFNGGKPTLPSDFTLAVNGRGEAASLILRMLADIPVEELARLYDASTSGEDFDRFFSKFSEQFRRVLE